jgi:hypothetical protein
MGNRRFDHALVFFDSRLSGETRQIVADFAALPTLIQEADRCLNRSTSPKPKYQSDGARRGNYVTTVITSHEESPSS